MASNAAPGIKKKHKKAIPCYYFVHYTGFLSIFFLPLMINLTYINAVRRARNLRNEIGGLERRFEF